MDCLDFLYEGVRNSIEAGASRIKVVYKESDEGIGVRVVDNGKWDSSGDVFREGYSTKGEKRGQGLYLINQADEAATLEREGDETVLAFTLNSRKRSRLKDTFPLIISLCSSCGCALDIEIEIDGNAHTMSYVEGGADGALEIAALRREFERFEVNKQE